MQTRSLQCIFRTSKVLEQIFTVGSWFHLPRTGATENQPTTILHVLTSSIYAVVCCNKPQFLYQEMVNNKNENFKSADMSKKEWRSNLNHVNILKLLWEASVFT